MKLRCAKNSVRLRIRKSDIDQLRAEGFVQESVYFNENQILTYTLKITHISNIRGVFENGHILIEIPQQQAYQWMDSEQVGLESRQPLHILIEKDFPCKHTSTEDQADTFYELVT